jgi:hypothetical protein
MILSFNLRTRCATASRRGSGEAADGLACVERAVLPAARDVRLRVPLPPAREDALREDALREDALRGDALREDALREDALREDPLREDVPPEDEPLLVVRRDPPLRDDEPDDDLEPLLLDPPLPEPLLLACGNFSSLTWDAISGHTTCCSYADVTPTRLPTRSAYSQVVAFAIATPAPCW